MTTSREGSERGGTDSLREELLQQRLAGRATARPGTPPRVDRSRPLPLSSGQRRLWFLSRLEPENPAYLVPLAWRLHGPLDVAALRRAADSLAARHEILRTRYELDGGGPVQRIDAPGPVDFESVDLSGGPAGMQDLAERERQAAELARREARTPFELDARAPFRLRLAILGEQDHLLIVVLHHIACDGWSVGVLTDELTALYRAALTGTPAQLPPLAAQYVDYAAWQRDQLTPQVLKRQLDHWTGRLDGLTAVTLPTDRLRPAVHRWEGDDIGFTVPAALADDLRALAAKHNATLYMVLVTALHVLLSRYSGEQDVAVGTSAVDRRRPETKNLIGVLLNTLVLRARWDGDPSFAELLRQGREIVLEAFDHQDVPLERLVDGIEPDRDLSHNPLFGVMVEMHSAPQRGLDLPGIRSEPVDPAGRVTKFDLTLHLTERADGAIAGTLEYATALFDATTAARMAEHYTRLLRGVATAPDGALSQLEIAGEAERRTMVVDGNATARPRPERPVHEEFARQAAHTPDAVAVTAGRTRMTYAELNARANQLAGHLRALGVGPERVVGICVDRDPSLLVCLLGVLKAGGAYLPLDPEHPAERLVSVLTDNGAHAVIVAPAHAGALDAFPGAKVDLDRDREAIAGHPAHDPATPDPGMDGLAYIMCTSGTTGHPKGVMVGHRSLMNYLWWTVDEYASPGSGGTPLFSSVAYDLAVPMLYTPLLTGQTVHLLPDGYDLADLGSLLAAAAPYGFVKLTPSHLNVLATQLTAEQAAGLAEVVVVAGEPFGNRLLDQWRALAGERGPRLVNEYGPTEITVANSAYRVEGTQGVEPLPIGRPMPNTTAYVLDDHYRPVPMGAVGEVYVGGDGVARGYRNQPALTAEKFVPDPLGTHPGGRLYRTGDLARVLPSGDFAFLGRRDTQLKLRGFRIEPGEIETALAAHPGVRDAAVVLVGDSDAERRLAAYLTAARESVPDADELRDFLAARLPQHMIPAFFVPLERLPLTGNGKTDLRALPAPGPLRPGVAHVPPRNATEAAIAAVWCEALGIERIGVHDNFFHVGGDSIRAVAVVGALRDDGFSLTVRDLFERRTIARLGELLATQTGPVRPTATVAPFSLLTAEDRSALPAGLDDAYPLSQIQTGMAYELLASGGTGNYHNVTALRINDNRPFDLDALRAAVALVVERHEALRTSIDLTSFSEPLQLVHATARMPVGARDLSRLTDEDREQEIRRHMAEERARPFDLIRPSLFRLFAHTGPTEWWLVLTECHPILEGWSCTSMIAEVLDHYRRIRDGKVPRPTELPAVRFADFIAAERESQQSPQERDFWKGVLDSHVKFALPSAWAGDQDAPDTLHKVLVPFDDLDAALRGFAAEAGVSLKSVLHAAHLKVMSMLTEERAVFTGLVCDGRPELAGADRVFGMYLNTVPFPFTLRSGSWLDLVQQVFRTEVEVWPHRRYPLPEMQRVLADGERLIEVFFNYLDFHRLDPGLVDGGTTIDDSPNEFALSATSHPGVLTLTTRSRAISRQNTERLAGLYRLVLEAMAEDPGGSALTNPLPGAELKALHEWNDTAASYRRDRCLGELVAEQAHMAPAAVAVVDVSGRSVSFQELNERANRLAHLLREAGAAPEVFVAVSFEHSVDMLTGLLGVVKSGAAYVPLDPGHPADRSAFVLADTRAAILVTQQHLLPKLPPFDGRVICLDQDQALLDTRPCTEPPTVSHAENLVYAMYTSGSTGRPKGVMITHRGLINYLDWAVDGYGLDGAQGAPMLGSIAFDLSVPNFWLPLIGGRSVTLLPQDRSLQSLAELIQAPGDFSLLKITPAHLDVLRMQMPPDGVVDSVRTFVVGADEVRPETVVAWRRVAPSARIINEYGPTETVVGCSVYETTEDFDPGEPLPIGRPIANTRMYVLDSALQPVPVGVVGELCIGGSGVARGYLRRPALTADKFQPDPYDPVPGARLYRTGDLARFRPDGSLDFLGRIDHQVKIRGYRVELGEIEALLSQHPRVSEAVAAVREETPGDKRLVAYVVPVAGERPGHDELRNSLAERLPDYMVPRQFVTLDALPLSAGGKVDRTRLPAPGHLRAERAGAVAPRTATERLLAGIWADLLRLDSVGVHDDFFQLGGYSLLAAQLVARVRAETGADVPLRRIYQAVTIAGQAEIVEECGTRQIPPVQPVPRADRLPLSFGQHRMWVLDQLNPRSPEYIVTHVLSFDGDVDAEVLRRALVELSARHEALRTRYPMDDQGPRQVVELVGDVGLTVVQAAPEQLTELANADIARGFDLATGPVWRALLVRLPSHRAALVLTIHHIACDGWSTVILTEELRALYTALSGGRPSPLAPLPVQYADFAVWQRTWLTDEALREDLDYWRLALADAAPLNLPTDRPRPAVRDIAGGLYGFRIPPALSRRIEQLGREHGATPFMALLTAYMVLLARHCAQDDICVGVPVAGRGRPEVHGVVGFFLNTVVLRTDTGGGPGFAELLDRVRQTAVEAFAHQDVPFERVVNELVAQRDPSRTPLFQALFDLHEAGRSGVAGDRDDQALLSEGVVQAAKTDLALVVRREADGSCEAAFDYATALFDRTTIERFADDYLRILEQAAGDPVTPLLPVRTAERKRAPAASSAAPAGMPTPPRTPTEKLLAAIWAEALGLDQVGVHDNFFDLGGDSVLAIRVVQRARRDGLRIPPRLIFEHQTVAALAASADTRTAPATPGQDKATGEVPLTPIQRWFTELDGESHHYNSSVLLSVEGTLGPELLERALHAVVDHHDALRLRLVRDGDIWRQRVVAQEPHHLLRRVDLSDEGPADHDALMERIATEAHRSLDLATGPLLRAVLFKTGDDRPPRLLITIHHLAVDSVSWQILLEDLDLACRQISDRSMPELPAATTTYLRWARKLEELANSDELLTELNVWSQPELRRPTALPPGKPRASAGPGETGTTADARTVETVLDATDTEALLRRVRGVRETRVDDVLLAALALTITRWNGENQLLVDVHGHGREDLFDDVDVSRSVGWFTSLYPVAVPVPADRDPARLLAGISTQRRRITRGGVGFGLLRYMRTHGDTGTLAALPSPPVSFNYLGGQKDQDGGGQFLLLPLPDTPGELRSPRGARRHVLEITASIRDSTLRMTWTYPGGRYDSLTMRRLAEDHLTEVRNLIGDRAKTSVVPRSTCPVRSPLTAEIAEKMAELGVPGLSLAVVSDARLNAAWGYGVTVADGAAQVTPDTPFQAGSVSKHVAALAALRLAGQGRLDLDAGVRTYLTSWRLPGEGRSAHVTVRQLLGHTAGLTFARYGGYARTEQPPSLLDVLEGRPPATTSAVRVQASPGEAFRYSGSHYTVLQQLLTDLTGQPFPELMVELVLDPLGMTGSSFAPAFPESGRHGPAHGHTHTAVPLPGGWRVIPELAAAGLWTTPADLARLALDVHGALRGEPSVVLTRPLAEQLLLDRGSGYGLGCIVDPQGPVFGHSGETDGYRCLTVMDAGRRSALVAMTNADSGGELIDFVEAALGREREELRWAAGCRRWMNAVLAAMGTA
ncbi:amino acid adenylation domain-containing protein [Streptomyces sp. NPDC006430]|uniref:amino acid adenylation domain-containing protein n=1 Tax=Streptomyces sp. NPDC006430 TaxID=3154299 RepID=UPI0033AAE118